MSGAASNSQMLLGPNLALLALKIEFLFISNVWTSEHFICNVVYGSGKAKLPFKNYYLTKNLQTNVGLLEQFYAICSRFNAEWNFERSQNFVV